MSCDRTTDQADAPSPPSEIETTSEVSATSTRSQASFEALPAPYSQADYNLGRRTFKLCQSCHTVAEGARDLVGPNLHGVFGRTVGSVDGFQYSRALQEADFVWSPERLEEWLANPRGYLPGNRMSFSGVRKPEARHAVIAYLMVESGFVLATPDATGTDARLETPREGEE
ncbi:c-type cytochrome [Henriciella marina]|uniref:c-type cytochrome n=1 Tax=Henriciella marina TaxID=453851 RepID=UPI0014613152|nr:cytochrome c family protein [Henriciella marina]